MQPLLLTRRLALFGGLATLGGCGAITSLNTASDPLQTYDLRPAFGAKSGRRTARSLLVARPQASAALASDRIMIREGPSSIAYLPGARWSDEVPLMFQSLLVRGISQTGRVGYVGHADAGPVPDRALLIRLDAFEVRTTPTDAFEIVVEVDLTVLNDRDQRVVASRRFSHNAAIADSAAQTVVSGFQSVLDHLLPIMADWTVLRM